MPDRPEKTHIGFTRAEATGTVAGEVRAVVLWEIASRCGQVPDLHPRLLEGIEIAARKIAAGPLRLVIAEAMYDAAAQAAGDEWVMWEHLAEAPRAYWLAHAEAYVGSTSTPADATTPPPLAEPTARAGTGSTWRCDRHGDVSTGDCTRCDHEGGSFDFDPPEYDQEKHR